MLIKNMMDTMSRLMNAHAEGRRSDVVREAEEIEREYRRSDQPDEFVLKRLHYAVAKVKGMPARASASSGGTGAGHVTWSDPTTNFGDLVLPLHLQRALARFVAEFRAVADLRARALEPGRVLLLSGLHGVGKTLTAQALAGELNLSLGEVRLPSTEDLRRILGLIRYTQAVYVFEDLSSPAIGGWRGSDRSLDEVLDTLHTLLGSLTASDLGNSVVAVATNLAQKLDRSVLSGVDLQLLYELPTEVEAMHVISKTLQGTVPLALGPGDTLVRALANLPTHGLPHRDIAMAARTAAKAAVLANGEDVAVEELAGALLARGGRPWPESVRAKAKEDETWGRTLR